VAQGKQLQHHYLDKTNLPYVSNGSVTAKAVEFTAGSNVLTSIKDYFERRNGFSAYTTDSFSGDIKRFHTWRRWTGAAITLSGSYFAMVAEVTTTNSRVWKQRVGTDSNFQLIHTDSTSTNPFDFVVSNNFIFFANGVDMKKYDGTTVTNWGITGPSAAVTFTSGAGSLSPVIGYQWVIAFGNSSTGHISSPSAVSTNTTGTARQFTISGNTTTDTQVDRVHVFRNIDGGSIFFELPGSPVTYANYAASGFVDNNADSTLTSSVAPLPNQNNRPTASDDPVWFANRIWTHSGDTLYYSDFEELVRGVEEEAFASTNLRSFGKEIVGKRVAGEYLLIFTADTIFRIYGDSLATFRMDTLVTGRGLLNRAASVSFSAQISEGSPYVGLVAWLDSSNTVWITDGTSLTELSIPIRPDIASIVHAQAGMAFHASGNRDWLILMDGEGGKLYVYDLDTKRWMPPWSITNTTAIYSGATAVGTQRLFLGRSKTALNQDSGYTDTGVAYTATATTNLFDIVPLDNPSMTGIVDHIEVETGTVTPTVKFLLDENPATGTFTTASTSINPPNRTQGTNLLETWFQVRSETGNRAARRASLQITFSATDSNFQVYGIALAYEPIT